MAAIEGRPILKLKWSTEMPVWIDQWPLSKEKLALVNELIEDQLKRGHIIPSTSPWNTPIFTIPKKSGKLRLLHDLQAINSVMQEMGPLQPGLPLPSMLPVSRQLLVINLKDCFFTIPLHEDDSKNFAFSVPSIKKAEPAKRYQWVVLPQGMCNSPTMCQLYVAPLRKRYPQYLIYHYMDDILIAEEHIGAANLLPALQQQLQEADLQIAPEKVQQQAPWKYLRMLITEAQIRPPKLTICMEIQTLTDAQKLIGDVQ